MNNLKNYQHRRPECAQVMLQCRRYQQEFHILSWQAAQNTPPMLSVLRTHWKIVNEVNGLPELHPVFPPIPQKHTLTNQNLA